MRGGAHEPPIVPTLLLRLLMTRAPAPSSPAPRLVTLLVAQLLDGFGARFHAVLVALYTLRAGGMAGFAAFTAVGLLGVVLSTVASGWLTGQLGAQRTMRVAGLLLALSRVGSYVLVAFGAGVGPLLVLRFLGSVTGQLMMNMAKAQIPLHDDASAVGSGGADRGRGDTKSAAAASLAWMNVANAAGQTLAVAVAGVVGGLGPGWLIALVGAPTATLPVLPLLKLARYATAVPLAFKEQLAAVRLVAPATLLAGAITLFVAGLTVLKDGLTVDLYSARWLGPVAAASLAGSLVAALAIPRVARYNAHPMTDTLVWPLLGAVALGGWAFADSGVPWLIASQFVNGIAGQILASFTEARILAGAGREGAVPALTVSGSVAAFASALSAVTMPPLLAGLGYAAAVVAITAPLLLLAAFGGMRLWTQLHPAAVPLAVRVRARVSR